MIFRTKVSVGKSDFTIQPFEHMLFVGSCFAQNIGKRFHEDKFRAIVNPFGVMYNPASILHTVQQCGESPRVAVLTLGTNRVYVLKETGEIVDNCKKQPQYLFDERSLSVDQCADYLSQSIQLLQSRNPQVRVIITVSPIRYAKYGFHGSALSKATLLLAAEQTVQRYPNCATYFPAYEIMNDELRDYRFYTEDMLHPTPQAIEYIWQQFADAYFSDFAHTFVAEWKPLKAALNHKPFNPDAEEYKLFMQKTKAQIAALEHKYNARLAD